MERTGKCIVLIFLKIIFYLVKKLKKCAAEIVEKVSCILLYKYSKF